MHFSLEVATLPRTIPDSITVTRALGYSYLWVDSLCIIQDSTEDWAAESVKMGGIYRRAVLTIAALHASGNHEGLFARRNPLCARSLPVPGTNFEISNTANYVFFEHQTGHSPLQSGLGCTRALLSYQNSFLRGIWAVLGMRSMPSVRVRYKWHT